ncbi:prephenate dehydrogenase [Falsirhodobacter deserti]|uniref:prephenate dehydrogenase n=1 Tax=Falsirhodobacter deserti TaxID=1365611 RepID=UPI000FE32CB3|nr:prephenate dehydrogenase [Falsirhodobacter deserti]
MSSTIVVIIGFGAFGRLAARSLSSHAEVLVCDPSPDARRCAQDAGLQTIGIEEVGRAEIVILAMPVPALESCLRQLSPFLRSHQVVLDVCSIKEEPVRMMQALLPEGVEILATHPMFGPQSANDGINGHQIVTCPVRGRHWRCIVRFLRQRLGLRVIIATPEEHDRQAALTQGLTHLLARAINGLGTTPVIRTRSFDLIMEGLAMVRNDAPEIFEAVVHGNRHVASVRSNFIAALVEESSLSRRIRLTA